MSGGGKRPMDGGRQGEPLTVRPEALEAWKVAMTFGFEALKARDG